MRNPVGRRPQPSRLSARVRLAPSQCSGWLDEEVRGVGPHCLEPLAHTQVSTNTYVASSGLPDCTHVNAVPPLRTGHTWVAIRMKEFAHADSACFHCAPSSTKPCVALVIEGSTMRR